MELYEAMSTLRAVRRLKPDSIPDDVLARVLQAGAWAPTGGNVQPWRVVVVKDPAKNRMMQDWYAEEWTRYTAQRRTPTTEEQAKTERMLAAGDYLATHWGEAPAVLVFCFNPAMMAITDAELERPSVVGGGSVYTAVQNVLLAARAEGLGCVLTTLLCYREEEVQALLDIPEGWGTCAHIPLGWPASKGHGPIARRPVAGLAKLDSWDVAYPE
jgi:nitroreductase